jgi:hypothetical protein
MMLVANLDPSSAGSNLARHVEAFELLGTLCLATAIQRRLLTIELLYHADLFA